MFFLHFHDILLIPPAQNKSNQTLDRNRSQYISPCALSCEPVRDQALDVRLVAVHLIAGFPKRGEYGSIPKGPVAFVGSDMTNKSLREVLYHQRGSKLHILYMPIANGFYPQLDMTIRSSPSCEPMVQDSTLCVDAYRYLSAVFLWHSQLEKWRKWKTAPFSEPPRSLSAMMQLELPHINVLSKIDMVMVKSSSPVNFMPPLWHLEKCGIHQHTAFECKYCKRI